MGAGQLCAMPMLSRPPACSLSAAPTVTLALGFRNDSDDCFGMRNLSMPMDNALRRAFPMFCAVSGATE